MAYLHSTASAPPLAVNTPIGGVLRVRHRHTDRFTVVGNHLAQHPTLSAVAMGLALHIQSLPDGASVTAKALTSRFREGETTIRRALNELEEAGYLERRLVSLGVAGSLRRRSSMRSPAADRPRRPKRLRHSRYSELDQPLRKLARLTFHGCPNRLRRSRLQSSW